MAVNLLIVMLMISYICEGALLRKSAASDFLQKTGEKQRSGCLPGGCSTEVNEAEELIELNIGSEESSSLLYNGGASQKDMNYQSPGEETVEYEGSGM